MQSDLNDQRNDKAAPAGYTTLTDPTFLASLPATARGLAVDPATDAQAEPDLQQPQPHEALVPASLAPSHPQQPASESDPSRASFTDATSPQSPSNAPSAADDPPYPPTFAELAQMIATGAPVPGIRDIPDLLAEGKPSESTAQVPKKPWERAGDGVPADAMSDS
ncbi:hypothetical protein BMF94_1351 [Rhodotorula taiwanensis]|uniref:Peroxisomal membrane protein PEX14-like KPWE domain-containing protein n=1 Tax=Rhodotorula taiwanensis TaxID=741276 RepID=A0A2S5BG31_9BASI|nr:hypothetical protein BMF94_1351 [Rhodotorula taiwanensis]